MIGDSFLLCLVYCFIPEINDDLTVTILLFVSFYDCFFLPDFFLGCFSQLSRNCGDFVRRNHNFPFLKPEGLLLVLIIEMSTA
jgi:hypothetical protein